MPLFSRDRLRVCAVSYLNTVPLIWGLQHGAQKGRFDLQFAVPAECADRLERGKVDIGIIPAVELLHLNVDVIRRTGIACYGPVRSILLISEVPLPQIKTVAVDRGSRTSVRLAQIILAERYGISPQITARKPDLPSMLGSADAALIIGDPALHLNPDRLGYHVRDLGQEWTEMTGLPMVFAVWAARRGTPMDGLEQAFLDSYREGREHITAIAQEAEKSRKIPAALGEQYLRHIIRFELGEREYQGLDRFLDLARQWEQQPLEGEVRA